MKAKVTFYIIAALLTLATLQSLALAIYKMREERMPILLPFTLSWEQRHGNESRPIYSQEADSFHAGVIPGITVDDVVRGMLSRQMREEEGLALSKGQAIQIFPIFKEMTQKRARLLQLRHLRRRLDEDSIQAAALIAQALTPKQLAYIVDYKGLVPAGEVSPWEQLIESLEKS